MYYCLLNGSVDLLSMGKCIMCVQKSDVNASGAKEKVSSKLSVSQEMCNTEYSVQLLKTK